MVTRISTRIRISIGIFSRSLQGELLFWRATYISMPPWYFKTIGVANYLNIMECTTPNSQYCIQIIFSKPNIEAIGLKACARKFLKNHFLTLKLWSYWNKNHILNVFLAVCPIQDQFWIPMTYMLFILFCQPPFSKETIKHKIQLSY